MAMYDRKHVELGLVWIASEKKVFFQKVIFIKHFFIKSFKV